jgi:hypothetical protein
MYEFFEIKAYSLVEGICNRQTYSRLQRSRFIFMAQFTVMTDFPYALYKLWILDVAVAYQFIFPSVSELSV